MARKRQDTLSRRTGTRKYRPVCWVSAEGQTERDYLRMAAFKDAPVSVRFPKDIHPGRRNPAQVLKRFVKAMREEDFRKGDEAWVVVDVDEWDESEFAELLAWADSDSRHHLAISNPKFELFLVMHFERGNGCTTAPKVDAVLKRHLPRYNKRLGPTSFSREEVITAVENARAKREGCKSALPDPGMTDAHLLASRLIGEE